MKVHNIVDTEIMEHASNFDITLNELIYIISQYISINNTHISPNITQH